MADKLVTIAQFANFSEASLAKQVPADFGIESVLSGQHAVDLYHIPSITADLQVFKSQAEKALEILKSHKKQGD